MNLFLNDRIGGLCIYGQESQQSAKSLRFFRISFGGVSGRVNFSR